MHNGFFDHLRDAVAFYDTRDTDPVRWFPEGKKFNDLPAQYQANVDVDTLSAVRNSARSSMTQKLTTSWRSCLH